ncbi:M20/M25/M40 family metallo-hydrolase [Kordia jejudonensis]|uniref:M20/M25/M40 family metallo-hydrolase n=1 Tax=Kordia jejudonensis TaxID=1348245 RepID=UPI0006297E12|nr:M20/M25/M40 family metallo-hydrolase [Kordia jejudonensis]
MLTQLKTFISIKTIANHDTENIKGIQFVTELLQSIGFSVRLEGDSPTNQPVLVAKYTNAHTAKKVVLYGHYDVEKINTSEQWDTPPFEVVTKNDRYYCRGIADNKGILLCRILALQEMKNSGEELPNILWIIQGEEEVAGPTPFTVIPQLLADYNATFHVEETGVYKKETPLLFHLPKTDTVPKYVHSLNEAIYDGKAKPENRQLNKFTTCPFVTNIPETAVYIGFGPNDGQCRIHKDNESLSITKLEAHTVVFQKFMRWILTTNN